MLQKCVNNIWFYLCNIFKKNMTIKDIVDYFCSEKIVKKGLFILRLQQVV